MAKVKIQMKIYHKYSLIYRLKIKHKGSIQDTHQIYILVNEFIYMKTIIQNSK